MSVSLATYVGGIDIGRPCKRHKSVCRHKSLRGRHSSMPPTSVATLATYVDVVVSVTLCSLQSLHRHMSVSLATYVGGIDIGRQRSDISWCADISRYAGGTSRCQRHMSMPRGRSMCAFLLEELRLYHGTGHAEKTAQPQMPTIFLQCEIYGGLRVAGYSGARVFDVSHLPLLCPRLGARAT